jgi:hypothetical protein
MQIHCAKGETYLKSPHILRHYIGSREFVRCCVSLSACKASSSHAKFGSVNVQCHRRLIIVEEGLCHLFRYPCLCSWSIRELDKLRFNCPNYIDTVMWVHVQPGLDMCKSANIALQPYKFFWVDIHPLNVLEYFGNYLAHPGCYKTQNMWRVALQVSNMNCHDLAYFQHFRSNLTPGILGYQKQRDWQI